MNNKPTIGRIVHYVLNETMNEHRPAIVVYVHRNAIVNLQVFTDGPNDTDLSDTGMMWRSSVEHNEDANVTGTWHWPERKS